MLWIFIDILIILGWGGLFTLVSWLINHAFNFIDIIIWVVIGYVVLIVLIIVGGIICILISSLIEWWQDRPKRITVKNILKIESKETKEADKDFWQ